MTKLKKTCSVNNKEHKRLSAVLNSETVSEIKNQLTPLLKKSHFETVNWNLHAKYNRYNIIVIKYKSYKIFKHTNILNSTGHWIFKLRQIKTVRILSICVWKDLFYELVIFLWQVVIMTHIQSVGWVDSQMAVLTVGLVGFEVLKTPGA